MSLGPLSIYGWEAMEQAKRLFLKQSLSSHQVGVLRLRDCVPVIAFDQPSLTVFGQVTLPSRTHRMAIQVSREEERRLRLDGATARGQAALSKVLPVLHLTPHVTDLISGSLQSSAVFGLRGRFIGQAGMRRDFFIIEAELSFSGIQRFGVVYSMTILLEPWERQIALLVRRWIIGAVRFFE